MSKRHKAQKCSTSAMVGAITAQPATRLVTPIKQAASLRVLFLPELLGRILSHAIPEPDTEVSQFAIKESKIPVHATYPPWPMMLVCKQWHAIVKSSPELWSTFVAIFHGCSASDMKHVPRMFDAHLRFSRGRALTLCFYLATERWAHLEGVMSKASLLFPGHPSSPTQVLSTLLDMARMHQRRWHRFSVRVDSVQCSGPPLWLMELVNDPTRSQLKHLKTGVYLDPPDPFSRYFNAPPLNLPPYHGLETLHVTGPFQVSVGPVGKRSPPPSFPSLRVLQFECYDTGSSNALWKILQESPYLEEANISVELGFPNIPSTISLYNLKYLRFSARSFGVGTSILASMKLPSLTRLVINDVPIRDQCLRQLAQVLPFLNAPLETCSLHIHLVDAFFDHETFGEVFKSMVQLEHLELAWIKSTPARSLPASVHRGLASVLRPERRTLLPCLTRLSIDTDVHDMLKNPRSFPYLRELVVACRKKFQGSSHHFQFGITSNMVVDEKADASFEKMLLQDPMVGECIAAEDFDVLVKFK